MSDTTPVYRLNHGCHRGTLASRDQTSETFPSYEAAHQAYLNHKKSYRSFGYQIWYANIVAPDGTKTTLEENPYV